MMGKMGWKSISLGRKLMNCWMMKRCGGSNGQGHSGLERVTAILNTFTIVRQKEGKRILSMGCGTRMDYGVATRRVLQPLP